MGNGNLVLKVFELPTIGALSGNSVEQFKVDLKSVADAVKESGASSAEFYFQNLGHLTINYDFNAQKGES